VPEKDSADAVRDLLSRLNDAWIHKRGEDMTNVLNECFADDVVMRGPGFSLAGRGRDLTVQSYQDFVTQAQIKNISLEPPEIDAMSDTAVAQYKWQMTYVLSGQEHTERGHDVFVLAQRGGRWLVVWRALLI
jgi:uncharacterized protein (TIGR02246 family)